MADGIEQVRKLAQEEWGDGFSPNNPEHAAFVGGAEWFASLVARSAVTVVTKEAIAETLRDHDYVYSMYGCKCGWTGPGSRSEHQASEVLALIRGAQ